jgi:hypothetical protein
LQGGTTLKKSTKGHLFLKKLLLVLLVTLTLPNLAFAADVQGLKTPAAKPVHPATINIPANKGKLALKREAKILSVTFRTEPSGKWLFTYNVQNKGAALDLRKTQLKTTQILSNGQSVPVHTVTLPNGGSLNPGQTVSGCYAWNRCSNATHLKLEVIYEGATLDSKTVGVPPLDVDFTKAAHDEKSNKWSASLKNNTGHAVKVAVRPLSDTGRPGQEVAKVVPANGSAQCTGVSSFKTTKAIQVIFRDEKPGRQPGYVVLDTRVLSSGLSIGVGHKPGDRTGIKAVVENIIWHRPTKQWVATVRNNTALPVTVGIAGFPLENGAQGMTVWSTETIPAEGTVELAGDYSSYSVPPGTRLKVHVLLKPSNTKIHEKIITLN